MIPRTRLIIMALWLCHAFVLPSVLTSQLRPSEAQQIQAENATPPVTVKTDSGHEDADTERLVQQRLQESDQDLGPQRPAMNVPLGRNEVLIRADQQEKNQDIYNARGHVEIRFGPNDPARR